MTNLRSELMHVKPPKVMDLYASNAKVGEIREMSHTAYSIHLDQKVDIKTLNEVLESYASSMNKDVVCILLHMDEHNGECSLRMEVRSPTQPRAIRDNPQA